MLVAGGELVLPVSPVAGEGSLGVVCVVVVSLPVWVTGGGLSRGGTADTGGGGKGGAGTGGERVGGVTASVKVWVAFANAVGGTEGELVGSGRRRGASERGGAVVVVGKRHSVRQRPFRSARPQGNPGWPGW